jgi:hypothetical protein
MPKTTGSACPRRPEPLAVEGPAVALPLPCQSRPLAATRPTPPGPKASSPRHPQFATIRRAASSPPRPPLPKAGGSPPLAPRTARRSCGGTFGSPGAAVHCCCGRASHACDYKAGAHTRKSRARALQADPAPLQYQPIASNAPVTAATTTPPSPLPRIPLERLLPAKQPCGPIAGRSRRRSPPAPRRRQPRLAKRPKQPLRSPST